MDRFLLIKNLLTLQSAILSTSNVTQTIIADTSALLVDQDNKDNHQPQKQGGSRKGRAPNLPRNFESGYKGYTVITFLICLYTWITCFGKDSG
jgi:hypothetical protein